jgi:hypothetical protein
MKKSIVRVGLYKARPAWSRLDVVPFALAYSVLHAMAWKEQEEVPLWLLIVIPIVLVLHALTHLCTHWSISCKARVAYSKVRLHFRRYSWVTKLVSDGLVEGAF